MVLIILRALFVLLMAAVGWTFILDPGQALGGFTWLSLAIAMTIAVLIISMDILAPRRKLLVFSGVFTGLVVGVVAAYALSFVVTLLVDYSVSYINALETGPIPTIPTAQKELISRFLSLLVGVACCYLAISFVLQTGDDFRFIIPYVEFSKQTRGARPMLLDTSALIDGRVADLADTAMIESDLLVPQFVVKELRTLADSADKLKRNRGKRGQEILEKLLESQRINCRIYEPHGRDEGEGVDEKIQALAKTLNARLITTDGPLTREARLKHIDVINLNDVATALKPPAMPGERMTVRLIKPGESPNQGVGYLDDGTMVVIEDGRAQINQDVEFVVTNARQTVAGKMIFGRIGSGRGGDSTVGVPSPVPSPPASNAPAARRSRTDPRPTK